MKALEVGQRITTIPIRASVKLFELGTPGGLFLRVWYARRIDFRRLIIFSAYVYVSHFYFERRPTRTQGHLILGVLVKFSGV